MEISATVFLHKCKMQQLCNSCICTGGITEIALRVRLSSRAGTQESAAEPGQITDVGLEAGLLSSLS